nr:tandem-95 repeat protein [Colwellia sp. PAMC 21821]
MALNDTYQVDEDNTLVIASVDLGILANDSDPNGLPFTLLESLLIQPQHGQLSLDLDGTFTYIPNSNFVGVDQFQYQISNSANQIAQAFVTITINPSADIPIALDDNYLTEEDVELVVGVSTGLLVNDVDFDNAILKVNTTPVNSPQKGTLVLAEDGSFRYLPNADFNGTDSFTYQVISASGLTNTANVNIVVVPLNDSPIAVNDIATTNEDTRIVVDVLANDIDKEGDTLSLVSVSLENGTAAIVNGKLDITPALNFFGQINIIYTMTDNINAASSGALVLTVLPINDAPIALNDSYNFLEDTGLNILVTDNNNLLSNDSDVDGDTLTVNTTPLANVAKTTANITLNTQPLKDVSNGTLSLKSNGSFTYAPNLNFSGIDSFTYQIMDGNGGTAQANVTLSISAVNDLPVLLGNKSFSFIEDSTLSVAANASNNLLSNASDADGDTLSVILASASDANLTLNTDGSFVYRPTRDFFGDIKFSYKVSDGVSESLQTSEVTLTISPVNDIPVVVSNTKSFTFDEDLILSKLSNDADNLLSGASDVDGDSLTVVLTSNVSTNGSLIFNADGSFSYRPIANYFGADQFSYTVSDGTASSEVVTVDLNIQAVNDAPILVPDPNVDASAYIFSINEAATEGDIVGTISASDIENDTLVYSLTSGDTSLFQIDPSSGVITVKGIFPLDFETNTQHALTATITDNGTPIAESSNVAVSITILDILGEAAIIEDANFGRTAFGLLELSGSIGQAQLNNSINVGTKMYFIGTIDNVDKDVYVVAYNTDGSLDTTFDSNGSKVFDFGAQEYGKAIAEISGNLYLVFDTDDGTYTEVCFLKIDSFGAIDTTFANSGLRCTVEQKTFSINNAVNMPLPTLQGVTTLASDLEPMIVAVGKVQGTDADTLVIRINENGDFQDTIIDTTTYSPHIILDVSGAGLDDEAVALYNPHNQEIMIAGNVLTANGDNDVYAWIIDPRHADGINVNFNNSVPMPYDISGLGKDDDVRAIGGINQSTHTAFLVGSTVLANDNKEGFILEIDKFTVKVPGFGVNGIATYDVDGDAGAGTGYAEFSGVAETGNEVYLSGTLFDGTSKPFTSRVAGDTGVLDTNYGVNGYQIINYNNNAFAGSMSIENTRTMWIPGYVESGSGTNMVISTVTGEGNLFTGNDIISGKNTIIGSSTPSDDTVAQVIQIQAGVQVGKYLTASIADDATNKRIILTRLTSTGQLDTTFDSDGHKQLIIGTSATVKGLFELASGNFIVYGNVTEGISTNGFVARIDQNGVLDTSFATNGIYTTSAIIATNTQFNQVKADTQERLIAVGNFESGSTSAFVLRLTAAGLLDTLFNTLGTQGYVIGANTDDYLTVVIDVTNGIDNIYAGGNRLSGDKDLLMAKYLVTGALENAVTVDTNSGIDESVEQLLFDSKNDLYWIGNDLGDSAELIVVKSNTSGVLDNSFSGDGKALFDMSALLELDAEAGVSNAAIDSNDNIVVVGYSDLNLIRKKKMIGRIKPDGSLDNAFDYNGYFRSSTCSNAANLESIVLINNSSFVVAGQCYTGATEKNNIDISHYTLN